MIETLLKINNAITTSNNHEIFLALPDETVEAVLLIQSSEGVQYTFVFKSGTSFVFNSHGAYWVNDQKTTRELVEREVSKNKAYHDQYHALHKLLGIEVS